MSKTIFDLSEKEIDNRANLTPKEQSAVDALIAAAKALPKSICFEVTDNWDGEGHLRIQKRITTGSAVDVAKLVKKSICFA